MGPFESVKVRGKRLLMEAALRLMARNRSFQALGLRELAREAGLNPNTFYRHFKTLDELGVTLIDSIAEQLRQPLRALRREAARAVSGTPHTVTVDPALGFDFSRGRRVTHESVKRFFEFVLEYPDAFIVGVRELYGPSPLMRQALQETIEGFATDLAEDIRELELLPGLEDDVIDRLSASVMRQLFLLSLSYIEEPAQRSAIRAGAEEQVTMLFTGAMVLSSHERSAAVQPAAH